MLEGLWSIEISLLLYFLKPIFLRPLGKVFKFSEYTFNIFLSIFFTNFLIFPLITISPLLIIATSSHKASASSK